MSSDEDGQNPYMDSVDGRNPRSRARDAIQSVAIFRDEFRLSDILEADPTLSQQTVWRACRELASRGLIRQRSKGSPYWVSQIGEGTDAEPDTSPRWQEGPFRILQCFADVGVEAEAIAAYGEVVRVGLNARDTNRSQPIKADAHALAFREGAFDLGVFHPECARFSEVTSISGNPEDHPNQIPLARELGERYCDDYVIENKPQAAKAEDGLERPEGGSLFELDGRQFGIPLRYERAFETSFPVDRRPIQQPLDQEVSPYFYADRSTEFWRSLKGYAGPYTKTAIAKNAIPAPFIHFILREWLRVVGETDRLPARSNHNDPAPQSRLVVDAEPGGVGE